MSGEGDFLEELGSGDDWDELLAEAQSALDKQGTASDELGEDLTPEPGQHVAGRWRGVGSMQTKRGLVDVYLVWDKDGGRGFLYQHARLRQEVEEQQPQLGDRVLVLRGQTETFEKDGQERTIYPYVLRRQPCDEPLPDESGKADIPF
jgi:hypothetical protein